MTVIQFQELYYIAKSEATDIDKSIRMVMLVTGLDNTQVDNMPMAKFNRICSGINARFELLGKKLNNGTPVKLVRCKGRYYQLHYDVTRNPINAGKYVEAITFGKDIIENLHKILATMATPVRWSWFRFAWVPVKRDHVDIASDMEAMNFEAAYHAAVFFYLQFRVSMQVIQPYLVGELTRKGMNKKKVEEVLEHSLSILDGFQMPKWSQTLKTYLLNRFGI